MWWIEKRGLPCTTTYMYINWEIDSYKELKNTNLRLLKLITVGIKTLKKQTNPITTYATEEISAF